MFVSQSASYRGKEHCEKVDGRLSDVAAFDGHYDGSQEGQIAECEQQSWGQLMTIWLSCRVISAAPTTPSCESKHTHELNYSDHTFW